jgi:hypothetical protein
LTRNPVDPGAAAAQVAAVRMLAPAATEARRGGSEGPPAGRPQGH